MHVLIVEDNEILGALLTLILEPVAKKVSRVDTMLKAQDCLSRDPSINVILLDLGLPDSTPEETVEAITSFRQRGPMVMVMSGAFYREELVAMAFRNGANGFFDKGQIADLCPKILDAVTRQKARLEYATAEFEPTNSIGCGLFSVAGQVLPG